MSLTWRERIAEARERGRFNQEDRAAISDFATCMVGEQALNLLGVTWREAPEWLTAGLRKMGGGVGRHNPIGVIFENNFDDADDTLSAIEDEAMCLKRENA